MRNNLGKVFAILLLVLMLLGCMDNESDLEQVKIQGVLSVEYSHKSVRSWMGHDVMVGDTPILPTEKVSLEVLKKFEGAVVVVTGVMYSDHVWEGPANEWEQYPLGMEGTIRGSGLKAFSIKKVQ